MQVQDVKELLDKNEIDYVLKVEPSSREFYYRKGFCDAKGEKSFWLMTIPNPNHEKDISLVFQDDSENSRLWDMLFGGHVYELFDFTDEYLQDTLIDDIKNILTGNIHVIFATDAKTGKWFYDSCFQESEDETLDDMKAFYRTVGEIKAPKRWWRKLTGRTDCYEIFNWNSYEKVIK